MVEETGEERRGKERGEGGGERGEERRGERESSFVSNSDITLGVCVCACGCVFVGVCVCVKVRNRLRQTKGERLGEKHNRINRVMKQERGRAGERQRESEQHSFIKSEGEREREKGWKNIKREREFVHRCRRARGKGTKVGYMSWEMGKTHPPPPRGCIGLLIHRESTRPVLTHNHITHTHLFTLTFR